MCNEYYGSSWKERITRALELNGDIQMTRINVVPVEELSNEGFRTKVLTGAVLAARVCLSCQTK